MHGTRHSACFRCLHEQSMCKRLHQVLESPSAWSAIWREWKHRHWEESRLHKVGNARINKVSAMRPGLAKIVEKPHTSRYFESPETDLHIAMKAYCVDYADTWLSKWVHWLSNSQSANCTTTYYGCEDTIEFDTGVAWASLLITRIHPQVAQEFKIQSLPATLHNSGWMDHCQVHYGSFEAIPVLDPVDVETAYSYSPSSYHYVKWHVRSYGWWYASFSGEEHGMEGRLILRQGVRVPEAVQILCSSTSRVGFVSHSSVSSWSFPQVTID